MPEIQETREPGPAAGEPARERIFHSVCSILAEAVVFVDSDQRITYFNTGAERLFGYPSEEALGRPLDMLLPERLRAAHRQAVSGFAVGPATARRMEGRQEVIGRRRSGEEFPAEASIAKVEAGGKAVLAVVLRDVSELRRSQRALQESEARYRLVMEHASDAIFIADTDGGYIDVNDGACRLLGFAREELIGKRIVDLVPTEDMGRLAEARERVLAGQIDVQEWRLRRKDGTYADIEVSTRLLPDRRWLALVRDIGERKRADAERQALLARIEIERSRLRTVIDNAPVGIIIVSPAGRISFNREVEEVLGIRLSEEGGREQYLDRLRHPDGSPVTLDQLQTARAMTSGEVQGGREYHVVRPDGTRTAILASAAPIRDDAGRVSGAVLMFQDMSEHKRLEEALRDSEERFRTAAADAPIGMALVGLDGRFLHVNRSLCEMIGYPEQELVQKTFPDITYGPDLAADLDNARRLLAGEIASYQMEKRYIHRQGHLIWIQLTGSLVRGPQGEPRYFIAQIQDVSARKRGDEAQRLLAEAGAALATSLDPDAAAATLAQLAVPVLADWCFVVYLEEGQIRTGASHAADAHRGEVLRELLTLHPYSMERQGPRLVQVLQTGRPALLPDVTEEMLQAAAEDPHHLELLRQLGHYTSVVAPLVARGRTLGALVLGASPPRRRFDVADLELAEELARRAALAVDNARLYQASQQATRLRDEVLRVVAHDLRNPLNTVNLSADLLLRAQQRGEALPAGRIEGIKQAVGRANRLIQDLLDVARMEAGHLSICQRPESLAAIIEDGVAQHRTLAEDRALRLDATIAAGLPPVLADRDRLLQVLSNLLGNAIKFTPPGGQVRVRARPAGDAVQVSVSDTGPGIAPADLPRLFDPFWQARKGTREGAGLGLAIARGIVEAHGGRIWVERGPTGGSDFCFTLPLVPPRTLHEREHEHEHKYA